MNNRHRSPRGERKWVDFQVVKRQVSIPMVLQHYGINWLRKSGDNLRGRCPIHEGEGQRSFHVSLPKNAFYCFSCKAKGNVLDFVAAMEQVSVRDAALKLQEWFLREGRKEKKIGKPDEPAKESSDDRSESINPPLGFKLRVDHSHEYCLSRGLSRETLEQFGAGFCQSKGLFSGRFVIPLHDPGGNLVGYAGRSIDESGPKYLFPSSEKGFHKKYLLFNLHRLLGEARTEEPVVVVEGFFGCMNVSQAGFPCVALLGSWMSEEQEELLCEHFSRIVLMFDGDEPGQLATKDCLKRLSKRAFVRTIFLWDGQQPDEMRAEELHAVI